VGSRCVEAIAAVGEEVAGVQHEIGDSEEPFPIHLAADVDVREVYPSTPVPAIASAAVPRPSQVSKARCNRERA
jgi:hypothetical protein